MSVVAVLAAAGCVFLIAVAAGGGVQQAAAWSALVGGLAAVFQAAVAAWPLLTSGPRVVSAPRLPGWVVDRPAEVSQVVAALVRRGGTVGITTGLHGAGGFGKTTLALLVCADRRVRRQFGGRVYQVSVGRGVAREALAAKVNDVIGLAGGGAATYTDPRSAGQALGALLDAGPRRLLVVDDVWDAEQLEPFVVGGRRCARLVTTRNAGLLAGRGTAVRGGPGHRGAGPNAAYVAAAVPGSGPGYGPT